MKFDFMRHIFTKSTDLRAIITPMKALLADNSDIRRSREVEVASFSSDIFACLLTGPLQLLVTDSDVQVHVFSTDTNFAVCRILFCNRISGQYSFYFLK